LNPTKIDKGTHWLTLKLKNIGRETLKRLDVQLHSLDTLNLSFPLYGTGHYLAEFKPDEDREVVFRVNAFGPAPEPQRTFTLRPQYADSCLEALECTSPMTCQALRGKPGGGKAFIAYWRPLRTKVQEKMGRRGVV
jgi:hypothetical protein